MPKYSIIFFKNYKKIHWRQIVLAFEIVILLVVGFIPINLNILANALVSFVAAMQVQTFRKLRGNAYASTMCIGNMRSGAEALCGYFKTRKKILLIKAIEYFSIIFMFAVGAGFGSLAADRWGIRSIWFSCAFLFISFIIMFIRLEIEEEKEALSLSKNRHHFKNIQFHSSLTGKSYYSKTKEDGTLGIYEKENDVEVPNNSNPSKRQILYSALKI